MRVLTFVAVAGLALSVAVASANPVAWQREFPQTDFRMTGVPIDEIVTVIPRDNIPAIDNPDMMAVADEGAIGDREPVITVEIEGAAPRAYPVRYLT